jgi:hypothetical protein
MSFSNVFENANIKLPGGLFVLLLSVQILGCSVNRQGYEKVDTENRWIRTFGDYEEFRFEQDQWIRITCWYHQLDDFSKGLEVGIMAPTQLLGKLGDKGVEIYSVNFGNLEMSSFETLNSGNTRFRFLKIPESSNGDYISERIRNDTVFIRMGEEQYMFVSSRD